MKVYGICAYDIDTVVREVSRTHYDGNVGLKSLSDCSNSKGPRATFSLRSLDSAAGRPGAMGNARRSGTGPNGMRRSISACWHAHWDVIEALLERYPDARIVSGFMLRNVVVRYTRDTFRETALKTAHLNIGSRGEPVTRPQCCECDHTLYSDVDPWPDLSLTPPPAVRRTTRPGATSTPPRAPAVRSTPTGPYLRDEGRGWVDRPPAAAPWTPEQRHAVKPGSDTVGDTLDKITELVGD